MRCPSFRILRPGARVSHAFSSPGRRAIQAPAGVDVRSLEWIDVLGEGRHLGLGQPAHLVPADGNASVGQRRFNVPEGVIATDDDGFQAKGLRSPQQLDKRLRPVDLSVLGAIDDEEPGPSRRQRASPDPNLPPSAASISRREPGMLRRSTTTTS